MRPQSWQMPKRSDSPPPPAIPSHPPSLFLPGDRRDVLSPTNLAGRRRGREAGWRWNSIRVERAREGEEAPLKKGREWIVCYFMRMRCQLEEEALLIVLWREKVWRQQEELSNFQFRSLSKPNFGGVARVQQSKFEHFIIIRRTIVFFFLAGVKGLS